MADNHLNRDFSPSSPGKAWVSDLTYIHTREGWLYLTIVMDLYDRKIIGWALSESMKAIDTSIPAWKMAIKNRLVEPNLIFHRRAAPSDRGVQYACYSFTHELKAYPLILQSMSRKGNCWDNAVAESFFKTAGRPRLKSEMVYQQVFQTRELAKLALFEYIETCGAARRYNRQRRHSALNHLSPLNYYCRQFQHVA